MDSLYAYIYKSMYNRARSRRAQERLSCGENREREIGDKPDGDFRGERFSRIRGGQSTKRLTPGDTYRREEVFNERTHRHSPYYTPDYCIA